MIGYIKKLDNFNQNIVIVFLGISLVNIFSLLYQLLIAHRMSSINFAEFNSLLSLFMLISVPLTTLQTAVVKYVAEFNAKSEVSKIQSLLSNLIKRIAPLAVITFLIFYTLYFHIMDKFKFSSLYAGYILALLLASSWVMPVLQGALQGLELFKWLMFISVLSGLLKLIFAFIFISLGLNISGALAALLAATLIGIIIAFFPLRKFLSFKPVKEKVDFRNFFSYLIPVGISSFCFISLVNSDMVLVKYFFVPPEAGVYSLAQMVGKIFLFLPAAISLVMFPNTAGLNAKNMDATYTLGRSLLYASCLGIIANIFYNFFPSFVLKILTGKMFAESVILGRLFGLSMSFFTLSFILINYFLSIKDLRFMKYLILSVLLQSLAIILFHKTLIHIQLILCINSILLFFSHLILVYKKSISSRLVSPA